MSWTNFNVISFSSILRVFQNGEYVWDLNTYAKYLDVLVMKFPAVFRVYLDALKVACIWKHSSMEFINDKKVEVAIL